MWFSSVPLPPPVFPFLELRNFGLDMLKYLNALLLCMQEVLTEMLEPHLTHELHLRIRLTCP